MTIVAARAHAVDVPLARPYEIHGCRFDRAPMVFLQLTDDAGHRGFGQAAPAAEVTGETDAEALQGLTALAAWLPGHDVDDAERQPIVQQLLRGPAARAAFDMARLDLDARRHRLPLADRLGRVHQALPTSITIGMLPLGPTLAEADEYLARGFTTLKVKIGSDLDHELPRLDALRRHVGDHIGLRLDANQAGDARSLPRLFDHAHRLAVEMIEQPLPRGQEAALRDLPAAAKSILCADESVHDANDLAHLLAAGNPFGIINVKLMKCGGPRPARQLAELAADHGLALMWGCNDESCLGIAAALHTAYACKATRYLDLDGSFDLAADPFAFGFALERGTLHTLPRPGLGAEPTP